MPNLLGWGGVGVAGRGLSFNKVKALLEKS